MRTAINIKQFLLAALAGVALLAGCSKEDSPARNGEFVPITFTSTVNGVALPAAHSSASPTRTTPDGDSWVVGDRIGIYMLPTGGDLSESYADAQNKLYTVSNASTGALAADGGTDIYFPQTGNVDFVAYYPHGIPDNRHTINFDLSDQSDPSAIDLLWAKAENVGRSQAPVALEFRHLFAKVTLDVTPGEGFTAQDIEGVRGNDVIAKMLRLRGFMNINNTELSFDPWTSGISLYKSDPPSAGAAATFSAIIVPGYTKSIEIIFTIAGQEYKCTLTNDVNFKAGNNYVYPVTVKKSGIVVGTHDINDWNINNNGTGTVQPMSMEVVKIKAGKFMMGSSDGSNYPGGRPGIDLNATPAEPNRYPDETQHWVELTQDFYMGKYAVTNAQYAAFLNAKGIGSDGKGNVTHVVNGASTTDTQTFIVSYGYPSEVKHDGISWGCDADYEKCPVFFVTWFGAKAFADWMGAALPTEAQWEYACRAGTTTAYSYGETADGDYMWYFGNNSHHERPAVGLKKANPWGLYDMHGNVFEWCADWYDINYYTDPSAGTDPTGPDRSSTRVMRGGSYYNEALSCRSAHRNGNSPYEERNNVGFRLVFPAP